jgi:SAM-dependent methyltransferase
MADHPSESVIDLYRRHAVQWDAARRSRGWNDRIWIDAFAKRLTRGSRVLDLGCAGGEPVARFLVEQGMQVTGVDSSPEMIALARDRMPEQDWIVADMRCLALGRSFDGILAWDSFFHLKHEAQRAMFPVFDAHAAEAAVRMIERFVREGERAGALAMVWAGIEHERALHQPSTKFCLTIAASSSCAMPQTTPGAAAERPGCAGRSRRVDRVFARGLF